MTVAEKLLRQKQDFDDVYEAGKKAAPGLSEAYEAGKASMVDESKVIEKTVSGSVISINDVSEIPHEIKCSISGVDNPESVRIVVVGKNLCDNIWEENGIKDSTGEVYSTSAIHSSNYLPIKPDTEYTLSKVNFTGALQFRFYSKDKTYIGYKVSSVGTDVLTKSFTTDANAHYVRFNIANGSNTPAGELVQLEEGCFSTEYEPHTSRTYTPDADGNVEGMSSISPYMCVFTDTMAVNIDLIYRQSWGVWYERKKMWNQLQQGGTRVNYGTYAAGNGYLNGTVWSFDNFYPQYDIRPEGNANHIFYNWGSSSYGSHRGSLSARLRECGVVLDTSKATSLNQAFAYSRFAEIPTIDFTGIDPSSTNNLVFGDIQVGLHTIEKIIVKEELTYTSWFRNNKELKHITVEGVIGNTFDVSACSLLTAESAKSVITHLKNYAGTDKEFANSVLFHANTWMLLDAEGNASPNGNTWREYADDLGWTT